MLLCGPCPSLAFGVLGEVRMELEGGSWGTKLLASSTLKHNAMAQPQGHGRDTGQCFGVLALDTRRVSTQEGDMIIPRGKGGS